MAEVIKGYLKKVVPGSSVGEDFTMLFWMIEYLALPK